MVSDLPQLLDHLPKRPGMYVHPVSFDTVRAFLTGLSAGLMYAGIRYTPEEYMEAARARGWDPTGSTGIARDFARKGLSDAEKVRALIEVEVAAYKLALARADHHG